jgi:hypothetical protein
VQSPSRFLWVRNSTDLLSYSRLVGLTGSDLMPAEDKLNLLDRCTG